MALCLAIVFAIRHLLARARPGVRAAAVVLLLAFLGWQSVWYRDYAAGLIRPIDITRTIEYKTAKWIDANLKGQRAMVSGDVGTWFNVFTDNPQLSSGHEPFLAELDGADRDLHDLHRRKRRGSRRGVFHPLAESLRLSRHHRAGSAEQRSVQALPQPAQIRRRAPAALARRGRFHLRRAAALSLAGPRDSRRRRRGAAAGSRPRRAGGHPLRRRPRRPRAAPRGFLLAVRRTRAHRRGSRIPARWSRCR